MNSPLEQPSDHSDPLHEHGGAADAAQRDLFEFLSAPTSEASSEHRAWSFLDWRDEVLHDEPARNEVVQDEPVPRDAAAGPGERATGAAVAALDEVSKANLRRLEETVSWLQSEAYRLPPAAPLPPVPGLPALEPIIDRSTMDRTLQRSPALPIWLQEQKIRPLPLPTRERGVFWPRAIKFAMACGIAAPLSYYFAVATSPLKKRLTEGAGMASLDSPVLSAPPMQRPPEAGNRLRVGAVGPELASAETRALAPERIVQTPRLPRSESPIRPRPETAAAATQAPATEAPVTEAPAVPAEPVTIPPARSPQVEAAQALIAPLPVTTGVAVDMARSSRTLAERPSAPAVTTVDSQEVKLLIDRGKQFFDVGDLVAARILFLRAANAGDAAAAVEMGATYDPVILAGRGVRGVAADLEKARSWYERAKEMGSPEGPRRLEMLANR
jgi:hypothetical protein